MPTGFMDFLTRLLDYPLLKLAEKPLTLGVLVEVLVLLVLVWVAEMLVRRFVLQRILQRTRLQPALQYAVSRIAGYLILLLGWFIVLNTVGLNLNSLAVFAGALGVGVGFGLQNVISNFISGLIILVERPVAVGDRVEVGGVGGKVREINLRSTTVITNDNISIIVPNSDLITKEVTNWSHGDPKVRFRLPVGIAYGSDVGKFRAGMLDVARANPQVLSKPEPDLFFCGFGESSLDFELVVWTVEMVSRPLTFRSQLYYAIEAKLRELNIEIPFPQRDLHIRSNRTCIPVQLARTADHDDRQASPPPRAV